jgi:hypothetical protein
MAESRWAAIGVVATLALALSANVAAQEKQLYRYTDANGKVVYSDTPPPPSAKNVQPKRIGVNVIETNEVPLAARVASERYPVTLYTFDCGDPCQSAEALLNKRGIPFKAVNVSQPEGQAKLAAISGGNLAPVMQVGDSLLAKGLNEPQWQAMLDQAGYPRAPSPRTQPPGKGTETSPMAKAPTAPASPGSASKGAAQPEPPTVAPAAAPSAPATDGGYPK